MPAWGSQGNRRPLAGFAIISPTQIGQERDSQELRQDVVGRTHEEMPEPVVRITLDRSDDGHARRTDAPLSGIEIRNEKCDMVR